jgi:hypothetical protein
MRPPSRGASSASSTVEPVPVLVALHPTKELRAAGLQPGDGGVDVIDGNGDIADAEGVRRHPHLQ